MYARAERQTSLVSGTTPAEVGPGAYLRTDRPAIIHGYAPFGSTATRTLNVESGAVVADNPGPGAYASDRVRRPAKSAGQPFKSRMPRFQVSRFDADTTPGPGSYAPQSEFGAKSRPNPHAPPKGSREAQGRQGSRSPVAWYRVPTAPSIPTPAQAFGYEETTSGDLIMQQPPEGQGYSGRTAADSVGPGAYEPPSAFGAGKPAPQFGKRSARTTLFDAVAKRGDATPGPGSYVSPSTFGKGSASGAGRLSAAQPSAAFRSSTKMQHQQLVDAEAVGPGPSAYQNIHSTTMAKPAPPPELQFFGSTQRRLSGAAVFGEGADVLSRPGPGAYNEPRSALRVSEPAAAPFNNTSARFASDAHLTRASQTPGPNAYDATKVRSISADISRRVTGRKGVFGSTTRRFHELSSTQVPGPAAYDLGGGGGGGGGGGPSSAFSSAVPRFKDDGGGADGSGGGGGGGGGKGGKVRTGQPSSGMSTALVPGATGRRRREPERRPAANTYMVPSGNSWDAPHKQPRGSSRSTFGATGHKPLVEPPKEAAPGPGAYDPPSLAGLRRQRGAYGDFGASREPRFSGRRSAFGVSEHTPGPGAYEASADALNPLVKRSFNITLGDLAA